MANTYNGEITEMTDWITGDNSVTGNNETGGLPASGKSIRNLLQKHLKSPIYLYQDITDATYKIFSSVEAKDLYYAGADDSLLLGEFDGPSAYSMKVSSLSLSTMNVKKLDTGGSCEVIFQWSCIDQNEIVQQSTANVTIVVANSQGVQSGYYVRDYDQGVSQASVDVYQYLQEGRNTVTVTIQSSQFGAKSTISYIIYLVSLTISIPETSFKWYNAIDEKLVLLPVRVLYTSSISDSSTLFFVVDGAEVSNSIIYEDADYVIPLTTDNKLKQGLHRLVVYAVNESNGSFIYSNILAIDFTVAVTDITSDLAQLVMMNKYCSFDNSNMLSSIINGIYTYLLLQYSTFTLDWGIWRFDSSYTYDVYFHIEESDGTVHNIASFKNVKVNNKGTQLKYTPENKISGSLYYTIGRSEEKNVLGQIDVSKFTYDISEQNGYTFKLSAKNKTNGVDTTWEPVFGECDIKFSNGVSFIDNNGWYQDSFRVQGVDNYAYSNNFPLGNNGTSQFTFEIDFYTEYVDKDTDLLFEALGCIKVYPTSASIVDSAGNEILTTNFKSNERVKIAFSRYPSAATNSNYNQLITIVTNGILERANTLNSAISLPTSYDMKIGGSNSGIRVYGIRYYNNPIYWKGCYNNWLFDFDNKAINYQNNDVYDNVGQISVSKCEKKIDVIKLVGNLGDILNSTEKVHSTVDKLERICPYDKTKDFVIYNCLVRKHGQSTLTYPIPSLKFWSNKQYDESVDPPVLEAYTSIYAKLRYQMKDGCIPANKWILQANFADSSGTHNGSIQRLIQNLWYNAQFKEGSKTEYKLRTPPQLFASNQTITIQTVPSTDSDYDQYKDVDIIAQGYNSLKKQWKDYNKTAFPYTIRNATDSFPCVVFYQEDESASPKFLGQYVFMDDKKSDYIYGERSIYNVATDPFCLTNNHKNDDVALNRIWDNSNVLRIELLSMDDDITDYIKECSTSYTDSVNKNTYEFIYPDEDDIKDEKKDAKFAPFVEFQHWVVSTKNDQAKFEREAYKHLDLYKMAAYYIFAMVFGLVDSIDRNAQVKTYDGKHFWYEIWDADIACGNKNTGGIKWPPGTDRTTLGAGTTGESAGAFSGKNSVLWNNLEKWDKWRDLILPDTAQALYGAGLKYDNVISMFDDNYSNKWCEYIYDKSGEYKYVESGASQSQSSKSSYLAWLLGARTTHRHWWIKTSIDYWFSKWGVGSFRESNFYITAYSAPSKVSKYIRILPSQKGYFAWTIQSGGTIQDLTYGTPDKEIAFDVKDVNMSPKVPFFIYGASYIKELNLSEIATALDGIEFGYSYDTDSNVSYLEKLNISTPKEKVTDESSQYYGGYKLASVNDVSCNLKNFGVLDSLKSFDATGLYELNQITFSSKIKELKLAAVGLSSIECSGNAFTTLELPNLYNEYDSDGNVTTKASLQALVLENCSWEDISFWDTYKDLNGETVEFEDEDDEGHAIISTKIIYPGYIKKSDTLGIPTIHLTGTTCSNQNSKDVVLKWLDSIQDGQINNTPVTFANLQLENVDWTDWSYDDVVRLGAYYNKSNPNIRGKITLASSETVTKEQLQELTNYFGDDVFVLNSGGLVIDYPVDVTIITVTGNNCSYNLDSESYEVTEKGRLQLRLNYTKFKLQETEYSNWKIRYKNTPSDIIIAGLSLTTKPNISLIRNQDLISNKTTYYLLIDESAKGSEKDYTLEVVTETSVMEVLVHSVTYPENGITFKDAQNVRYNSSNKLIVGDVSSKATFYLDETDATATVSGYKWIIQKGDIIINDQNSGYIDPKCFSNVNSKEFNLQMIDVPLDTVEYTLKINVTYYNDSVTYSTPLTIVYDPLLLNSTSSTVVLTSVRRNIANPDGSSNFYKTDIERITEFSFTGALTKLDFATLLSTSDSHDSIFKYLTNVIYISGVNSTNVDSVLFDEDLEEILKLSTLYTLNLQSCILHNDTFTIDVSKLTNLKNLLTPQRCNISIKNQTISYIRTTFPKSVNIDNLTCDSFNNTESNVYFTTNITIKNCKYPVCPLYFLNNSSCKGTLNKIDLENYTITTAGSSEYLALTTMLYYNQNLAKINISTLDTMSTIYQDMFAEIRNISQSWYDSFKFDDYYVIYNDNTATALYDQFNTKYFSASNFASGKYKGSISKKDTLTFAAGVDLIDTFRKVNKNADEQVEINLLSSNYFGRYSVINMSNYTQDINITDYDTGYPDKILVGKSSSVIYKHSNRCTIEITDKSTMTHLETTNITNAFSILAAIDIDNAEFVDISCSETITDDISSALNKWVDNKDKMTLSGTLTAQNTHLTTKYRTKLEEVFPNVTFVLGSDAMEFTSDAVLAYVTIGYNCIGKTTIPDVSSWTTSFISTDFSSINMKEFDAAVAAFAGTFTVNGTSYTGAQAIAAMKDFPESGYFNWGGGNNVYNPTNLSSNNNIHSICVNLNNEVGNAANFSWSGKTLFVQYVNNGRIFKYNTPPGGQDKLVAFWNSCYSETYKFNSCYALIPDNKITYSSFNIGSSNGILKTKTYIFSTKAYPDFMSLWKMYKKYYDAGATTISPLITAIAADDHVVSYTDYEETGKLPN